MTDQQKETARKDLYKRLRDAIGKEGYGVVYAKQLKDQIKEESVRVSGFSKEELLEVVGEAEASYLEARSNLKTKKRKAFEAMQERVAERSRV